MTSWFESVIEALVLKDKIIHMKTLHKKKDKQKMGST